MILQDSPFFIPLLVSALITGILAFLGWNHRSDPESPPYVLLMGATTFWTFFYAMQLVSADLATNIMLNDIEYLGIVTVPVAWLLFVLCYTGREQYVTRRNVLLLFIVPAVVICLVVTNPYSLYYTAISPENIHGSVIWVFSYGPLFWIHAGYSYLLSILALVLVASLLSGYPGIYRRQIILMIIAAGIPVLANMLYVFKMNPEPGLDLTPFAFMVMGLIVVLGITRYQLFSMVPVAYPLIFTAIDDGIIVVDRKNRIRDLNPAASKILQGDRQSVIGKYLTEILPQCAQFSNEEKYCTDSTHREISIERDGGVLFYDVMCRKIPHKTGFRHGYLMIFRDITEKRRSLSAIELANKKLVLLTSVTRHDIKNQLTVLIGYLDLSEDALDKPEELGEYIAKEREIADIISRQISLTRYYEEMGMKAPSWQNAGAIIRRAATTLPMRNILLEVDCKDLEIYADPLCEKVFYNLIDNALRYGGDGMKTIRVRCQDLKKSMSIVCEDDGVGISDADKKRLFSRGFGRNTGLGLFLSREILAITGITITENGIPGKGARFEITVPEGMYRFRPAG